MRGPPLPSTVKSWLAEPLPRDVKLALARLASAEDVRHVAVMPDVHLADEVCVGTVLATKRLVYPQAVGGDIGCGMAAVRFECEAALLDRPDDAARLLDGLSRSIPAIRHPATTARDRLPAGLEELPLSHGALEKLKSRDGRVQFATLGRGNHFLEFQEDPEGALWLMVHSGSRAMGQAIRDHHLREARTTATGLQALDVDAAAGQGYLSDLRWACAYAEESRRALVTTAAELLGSLFSVAADLSSFLTCHHNHARRETHFGEELLVHRKGAIGAAPGEPGIIPGSMGTSSYHVEGRGCADSLASSSHGAGRAMGRAEAFKKIRIESFRREMEGIWYDRRLTDALRDEAPSAYKDIQKVMRAQRELTKIVRKLRPKLSYKGA